MKTRIPFILALFILAFASCENDEPVAKTVLEKIVSTTDQGSFNTYFYNENGLPTRREFYVANQLVQYTNYNYTDGQLTSKDYYESLIQAFSLSRTYGFQYSADRKLIRITIDKGLRKGAFYTLLWEGDKIVRVDFDYVDKWSEVHETLKMEYNAAGNMNKLSCYENGTPGFDPKLNFVIEYEFDDKVNPLFGVIDPSDFVANLQCRMCPSGAAVNNMLSPNNVVRETRTDGNSNTFGRVNHVYMYDSFDRPSKMKTDQIIGSMEISTESKFIYRKL